MPKGKKTPPEPPPLNSIVRVRPAPGKDPKPREAEVLEQLEGGKRLRIRYLAIDQESDVALTRLERNETGGILLVPTQPGR